MRNEAKLLLNEKDAAELLSMSTHFLRRDRISCESVGIPYLRIGASVRYRRVDLECWIDRMLRDAPTTPSHQLAVVGEKPVPLGRGRPRKTGKSRA